MARKVTKKVEVVRFVVEGTGDFPSDMLRYDCCFPVNESEARGIAGWARAAGGVSVPRRVCLEHRGNGQAPNMGRWKSFGWTVLRILRTDELYQPDVLVTVGPNDVGRMVPAGDIGVASLKRMLGVPATAVLCFVTGGHGGVLDDRETVNVRAGMHFEAEEPGGAG